MLNSYIFRFESFKIESSVWEVFLYYTTVGTWYGSSNSFVTVINFTDGSSIFVATNVLWWTSSTLMVLSLLLWEELISTVTGVVFLSLTHLTSVVCVIMWSRMSMLSVVIDGIGNSGFDYSSVDCVVVSLPSLSGFTLFLMIVDNLGSSKDRKLLRVFIDRLGFLHCVDNCWGSWWYWFHWWWRLLFSLSVLYLRSSWIFLVLMYLFTRSLVLNLVEFKDLALIYT